MNASLSYESRIKRAMLDLDCTNDFLCALAEIPASRLSLAFRCLRPLSQIDGEKLLAICKELQALIDAAAPIPVALKDPILIKELLAVRRKAAATVATAGAAS